MDLNLIAEDVILLVNRLAAIPEEAEVYPIMAYDIALAKKIQNQIYGKEESRP